MRPGGVGGLKMTNSEWRMSNGVDQQGCAEDYEDCGGEDLPPQGWAFVQTRAVAGFAVFRIVVEVLLLLGGEEGRIHSRT